MTLQKPTPRPRVHHPLKSKPRGVNPILREQVFECDNWTCQWCKVPGGRLDPHHVLPRGRGGVDSLANLKSTHRVCHRYIHEHPVEAKRKGLLR